jgi:hypothetical protein
MTPQLTGEVLALNLYTRSGGSLPRLCRIIRKLGQLLAGADDLREAAKTAEAP